MKPKRFSLEEAARRVLDGKMSPLEISIEGFKTLIENDLENQQIHYYNLVNNYYILRCSVFRPNIPYKLGSDNYQKARKTAENK